MTNAPDAGAPAATRQQHLALSMLAGWMSERWFRTFRPRLDEPTAFDALIARREARIGVTLGLLWGGRPRTERDAARVAAQRGPRGRRPRRLRAVGAARRRVARRGARPLLAAPHGLARLRRARTGAAPRAAPARHARPRQGRRRGRLRLRHRPARGRVDHALRGHHGRIPPGRPRAAAHAGGARRARHRAHAPPRPRRRTQCRGDRAGRGARLLARLPPPPRRAARRDGVRRGAGLRPLRRRSGAPRAAHGSCAAPTSSARQRVPPARRWR